MRAGSELRRAIVGATVGLLYGSILAFVSVFAAGGGHGTSIPLLLSSAPLVVFGFVSGRFGASYVGDYGLLLSAPLLWAVLGSLVALSGRGKTLRLTQVLILLHYASGLALVAIFAGPLPSSPEVVVMWVTIYLVVWGTVYLVGQVALWSRIMRRNQSH